MALEESIRETIEDLDVSSFRTQDSLCPKLWDGFDLKEEVREQLLKIAHEFYDFLKLSKGVLSDICLVGSLANYNWSKYSDIDVHLVMDFTQVIGDPEMLRIYFDARKENWRSKHNILVHGFEVELYVEDVMVSPHSDGRYSLITGNWIQKPTKSDVHINELKVRLKAESFIEAIEEVRALQDVGNPERAYEYADKLYDKIQEYRKAGLEQGGEYSTENIVFKALRRNGAIQELRTIKNALYDRIYSL